MKRNKEPVWIRVEHPTAEDFFGDLTKEAVKDGMKGPFTFLVMGEKDGHLIRFCFSPGKTAVSAEDWYREDRGLGVLALDSEARAVYFVKQHLLPSEADKWFAEQKNNSGVTE